MNLSEDIFYRLYHLIRYVLIVVFLWSGITKLINPKSFAIIIEAYGLIPQTMIMPTAIALPLLEVIAAIGLLCEIRGSLGIISGLLLVFMLILGYGIQMGLDIDCGCFGADDPEAKAYAGLSPALYRDMVMMIGVIYLYVWRLKNCVYANGLQLKYNILLIKENV